MTEVNLHQISPPEGISISTAVEAGQAGTLVLAVLESIFVEGHSVPGHVVNLCKCTSVSTCLGKKLVIQTI